MTPEDIAMKVFGLAVVSFPATLAAFKYAILDNSSLDDSYPGGETHLSLLILYAYVLLLGSLVGSGSILTDVTGKQGDIAVFFMEGFGLIIGIPVITTLRQRAESRGLWAVATLILATFWILILIVSVTGLFLTVLLYT